MPIVPSSGIGSGHDLCRPALMGTYNRMSEPLTKGKSNACRRQLPTVSARGYNKDLKPISRGFRAKLRGLI